MEDDESLTSDEAARLLDRTRSAVQKMVRDGRLEATRNEEGSYRFRRQDIEQLRQEHAGRRKPGRPSFWELP